jgi:hypothetical protein
MDMGRDENISDGPYDSLESKPLEVMILERSKLLQVKKRTNNLIKLKLWY